jgi:hypothetical protein
MCQPEELPQKRFFRAADDSHIRAVPTPAWHGAEADDQDRVQRVPRIRRTRVIKLGEAGIEPFHGISAENPILRTDPASRRKPCSRQVKPYAIPLGDLPTPIDMAPPVRQRVPAIGISRAPRPGGASRLCLTVSFDETVSRIQFYVATRSSAVSAGERPVTRTRTRSSSGGPNCASSGTRPRRRISAARCG